MKTDFETIFSLTHFYDNDPECSDSYKELRLLGKEIDEKFAQLEQRILQLEEKNKELIEALKVFLS